jgi:hypothetical protein
MKRMSRIEFLKTMGRWSALAALAGFGATLLAREDKFSCNDLCGSCPKFKNGKCGIGRK